jgi:hypothetical protein
VVFTGEGADLIDDVQSAGEIVIRLADKAERVLAAAIKRVVLEIVSGTRSLK